MIHVQEKCGHGIVRLNVFHDQSISILSTFTAASAEFLINNVLIVLKAPTIHFTVKTITSTFCINGRSNAAASRYLTLSTEREVLLTTIISV